MKIKEFIKRNTTGVIIGAVFFGGITGVVAATALTAADVTYTGNNQTTVKSALDDLYTKANQPKGKNNTVYFAFGEPTTSSTQDYTTLNKKVFVALNGGQKSVCIIRYNKLQCFDSNNWAIEKDHIQQVFSDISCYVSSSEVECLNASDFECSVDSDGYVSCGHLGTDTNCTVYGSGSMSCQIW